MAKDPWAKGPLCRKFGDHLVLPCPSSRLRENPSKTWLLFGGLVFLDATLSFGPFSLWERFWIYGLVLSLLLVWAGNSVPATGPKEIPLHQLEFISVPSHRWLWFFFTIAVFLRLYGLTSLPVWPLCDDALYSYYPIQLSEKWHWALFFSSQQSHPLFTWLQGLYFKWFEPSLFSMWLFPALFSILAVPAFYAACRQFFSKSFSFLCGSLMVLGFWPIFWGKFITHFSCLNLVLESVLFLLLAQTVRSPGAKARPWAALGMGVTASAGIYTSILFFIPTAICFLTLTGMALKKDGAKSRSLFYFLLPLVLLTLPLAPGVLRNILKGHIGAFIASPGQSFSLAEQSVTSLSYLTSLFFGSVSRSYCNYGPLWGGFLNPLCAAAFFLGSRELFRSRRRPFGIWFASAFLLFLLPGLFSNTIECMRIFLILPLVLVAVAVGIQVLLSALNGKKRVYFLIIFFSLSAGLDLYHLLGPYHQWSLKMDAGDGFKSPERYQAFLVLEGIQKEKGPGLVFSDFVGDVFNQSLLISTYPFNAARNPRLSPEKARWAAVLCARNYLPPLARRFPSAKEYPLENLDPNNTQRLGLAVIPIDNAEDQQTLLAWVPVHREVQDLFAIAPYLVRDPDFDPAIRRLQAIYPRCEKDPILQAWVLEKILDDLLVGSDYSLARWFLAQPSRSSRSFPFLDWKFAAMYHQLGLGLLKNGEKDEARKSFRRAAEFDSRYPLTRFLAMVR